MYFCLFIPIDTMDLLISYKLLVIPARGLLSRAPGLPKTKHKTLCYNVNHTLEVHSTKVAYQDERMFAWKSTLKFDLLISVRNYTQTIT